MEDKQHSNQTSEELVEKMTDAFRAHIAEIVKKTQPSEMPIIETSTETPVESVENEEENKKVVEQNNEFSEKFDVLLEKLD